MPRLQCLDFGERINLNNLPHTICNLSQLKYLDIRECISLQCLSSESILEHTLQPSLGDPIPLRHCVKQS